MKTDEFRKLVAAKIKSEFSHLGFKKNKWHYLCNINEETVGMILLNHVSYGEQGFAEAPIVSVRNTSVSRILSGLFPEVASDQGAEFLTNIGYLMPINRWTEWQFSKAVNIDEIIHDMIRTVKIYGITFMKRMSDLNGLLEEITIRPHINPKPLFYTPAIYLLLGRKTDAVQFTQTAIEETKRWEPQHQKVADRLEEQAKRQGYIVINQRPEPESPEQIAKIINDRLKYYEPFAQKEAKY